MFWRFLTGIVRIEWGTCRNEQPWFVVRVGGVDFSSRTDERSDESEQSNAMVRELSFMKTIVAQLQGLLRQTVRTLRASLAIVVDESVDFFLRMKIRVKLSIIVAVSIIVVTFIISSIALQVQERELRVQTTILGMNIAQGLAAVAEDNLLLSQTIAIQDYVKNFQKRTIPALEHMLVMDRSGMIVAHFDAEHVDHAVAPEEWDKLTRTDSIQVVESPIHLQFVQAMFIQKRQGKRVSKIFLGSALVSFSKEAMFAPLQEMKDSIILWSFLVSCLAISVVYFMSKKIVQVIIRISEAARLVGLGNLNIFVLTSTKDELGTLATDFNKMVIQIRQKVEMQKFVSKGALEVLADGKEARLDGARRIITVLFTDVRNFTTISEGLWPEETVDTLNRYLDLQTKIIHQHEGVVDKFLGDGLMTIFQGKEMVANAVTAAIAIQKTVAELNRVRLKEKAVVLHVGIGIAIGPVVLGNIGSSDRMDYTVIGDTVNLASRLCGLAGPGEIFVTEQVARRLGDSVSTTSQGKVQVKGKSQSVDVSRIIFGETSS